MARLFISYNHRDRAAAFALRQWLIERQEWSGHEIFVDAEDLTAGVEWHPKLLAEAESSEVMLFLASGHSLHVDSFCYTELQSAKGQILVVTLGGVTPDDPRFDKALARHPSAKARQITPLDVEPVEDFAYEAIGRYPAGSAALNRKCVESIGNMLRELGVAPNSFSWTPKDEGPFPGLRLLMEGDEAIFRGRDLEIRDGIKALDDLRGMVTGRALLIQAPSGAGKSSFLRAGLWRRLRRHPAFTPLAIVRAQSGVVRHPDWGLLAGLSDTLKRNEDLGRTLPLAPAEVASRAAEDLPALIDAFADADAIEGRRHLAPGDRSGGRDDGPVPGGR